MSTSDGGEKEGYTLQNNVSVAHLSCLRFEKGKQYDKGAVKWLSDGSFFGLIHFSGKFEVVARFNCVDGVECRENRGVV